MDLKIAKYNTDGVKKSIGKNGVIGKGIFGNSRRDCSQTHLLKGSIKILNNYRGIFVVNIMSIIFEKLLNVNIMSIMFKKLLKNSLKPHFQYDKIQIEGGEGKGVTANLHLMRGVKDRAKYLRHEVWFTSYDIENPLTVETNMMLTFKSVIKKSFASRN